MTNESDLMLYLRRWLTPAKWNEIRDVMEGDSFKKKGQNEMKKLYQKHLKKTICVVNEETSTEKGLF